MKEPKPDKVTEEERAIVKYGSFSTLRKCSSHDGGGMNCDCWFEIRAYQKKNWKRISISNLKKCYDLDLGWGGSVLGSVKRSLYDKVEAYDKWIKKESKDLEEYKRLKEKFK